MTNIVKHSNIAKLHSPASIKWLGAPNLMSFDRKPQSLCNAKLTPHLPAMYKSCCFALHVTDLTVMLLLPSPPTVTDTVFPSPPSEEEEDETVVRPWWCRVGSGSSGGKISVFSILLWPDWGVTPMSAAAAEKHKRGSISAAAARSNSAGAAGADF
jgi:hypothetical protein